MKGSTIGLISLLVLLASQALPADPIRLGFLFTMSGRSAAHGVIAKQGADTALAEANASGGIMGREVVGLFEDEGKPDTSVKVVEKLVNQDKVDAIIGVVSSAVASKVAAAAKDLHVPLIVTTAHANEVTGQQCNRYTFRVTWSDDQAFKSAALLAAGLPAKAWTTIGPNYVLGWESWDLFQQYLGEIKPDTSFSPKSGWCSHLWTPRTGDLPLIQISPDLFQAKALPRTHGWPNSLNASHVEKVARHGS